MLWHEAQRTKRVSHNSSFQNTLQTGTAHEVKCTTFVKRYSLIMENESYLAKH